MVVSHFRNHSLNLRRKSRCCGFSCELADHAPGNIDSGNVDSPLREVYGVFACACSQIQNACATGKSIFCDLPDFLAHPGADRDVGELFVVVIRVAVEGFLDALAAWIHKVRIALCELSTDGCLPDHPGGVRR